MKNYETYTETEMTHEKIKTHPKLGSIRIFLDIW